MMQRSFVVVIVACLLANAASANPPPLTSCIKDMSLVYQQESKVDNVNIKRVYTLCSNTVFTPGIANPKTGLIAAGQEPLVCKSNCLIKCGANGSSKNNCIIDGTGSFGIFQVPYNTFASRPKGTVNVVYQGLTVDFFVANGQIPTLAAAFFGDVTFKDCIWSNNSADPVFVLAKIISGTALARSATSDLENPPGFVWKTPVRNITGDGRKRELTGKEVEHVDTPASREITNSTSDGKSPPGFVWKKTVGNVDTGDDRTRDLNGKEGKLVENSVPRENARRRLRAADLIDNEGAVVTTDENRILQASDKFIVSFEDCLFDFNDPVRNAVSQGGLSLIRFVGNRITGSDGSVDDVLLDTGARFINCRFRDNVFNINNDAAGYRSLIDFYSKGSLVMKNNCFINSPVKKYGVVLVQAGASVTEDENFVQNKQKQIACPFIAILKPDYELQGCGQDAQKTTCAPADKVAATPFCFPGDANCDVQGRGAVFMKDLKLGDKVRVHGGKFEPIYSFGHRHQDVQHEYLKLVTSNRALEISKAHMVFVEGGRSVPASTVRVGDKLQLADGELAPVVEIVESNKRGAYAPFTESGTVVVNGVTASSFVSFQESETLKIGGSIDTGLSYQFLAHAFETPHRTWCQYVSPCRQETYTTDGISLWVSTPHMFTIWFLKQDAVSMVVLGLPLLAALLCMVYPFTLCSALAIILTVTRWSRWSQSRCKAL